MARSRLVKQLDEKDDLLPEHVGVDLFRAASAWRTRLEAEMVALGHAWYGDARGAVAAHLHPAGMSQSALVLRMGLTKQAVQQLVDGLERDGIVRREPDPEDGRGKRVVYTASGLAALRDAVKVKRTIERDYRARLGERDFTTLIRILQRLVEVEGPGSK